jgi:hypothetical protein
MTYKHPATPTGWSITNAADAAAVRTAAGFGLVPVSEYGAVGNSTTNDRAAFASANTAAVSAGQPILVTKGTYKISTDLTLTAPVKLLPGAILRPDAGVTVSLTGGVTTDGLYRIFDQSAGSGAKCVPLRVEYYHPAWWGPTGTADDSQTWKDMLAAGAGATQPVHGYTQQRILVPAGESRLWEVDINHFHLEGGGRSARIIPPSTATAGNPPNGTGYIVRVQGSTTVSGVSFEDGSRPGITVIFWTGSAVHLANSLVTLRAANTIGIWTYTTLSTQSIQPKIDEIWIQGVPGSDATLSGTGIKLESHDMQLTNATISDLGKGIDSTRAHLMATNTHIWQCQTNIYGYMYHCLFSNCTIANAHGWGVDLLGCFDVVFDSTCYIWDNGQTAENTGGIRLRGTISQGQDCRIDALISDNYGYGLYLESMDNVYGSPLVTSKRTALDQAEPPKGHTGIYIDAACRNINLNVLLGESPVVTGKVVDNLSGEQAQIHYPPEVSATSLGGTSTSNGINTWAKLGTFSALKTTADFHAIYTFAANFGASGETGVLSLRLRNQSSPTGSVEILALGGWGKLTADSFKLISGAQNEPFELWVQKKSDFLDVKLQELTSVGSTDWTISYPRTSAWQSATPTGTAGNWTSIKPERPSSETTVTSGATLTMTVRNAPIQVFTGSTTHIVRLPTTFVAVGQGYTVINNSTGDVTVQSSAGNTIATVRAGQSKNHLALTATPTAASHWSVDGRTIQTVTTATTLGANGDYVVFISGTNGAVTLPTAVGNTGRYTLKNIHTADKTVSTTSSQTIDGGTLTILPGDSVDVISDGTNWRIV